MILLVPNLILNDEMGHFEIHHSIFSGSIFFFSKPTWNKIQLINTLIHILKVFVDGEDFLVV
ncbi:MAG: hypothetical protein EA359_00790, partial [Balneolaceae bacterium]